MWAEFDFILWISHELQQAVELIIPYTFPIFVFPFSRVRKEESKHSQRDEIF